MATLKTATTIASGTAWHTTNDGTGSGCDADMVDGLHAASFVPGQNAASLPAPRFAGDVGIDSDSWPREWDLSWHTPLMINGWVPYNAVGADEWGQPRYRKTMSSIVIMEGLIKNGTASTVFRIPYVYRPQYHFLTATIGGGNYVSRVQCGQDGWINVYYGANANNSYLSLCCWWYGAPW